MLLFQCIVASIEPIKRQHNESDKIGHIFYSVTCIRPVIVDVRKWEESVKKNEQVNFM